MPASAARDMAIRAQIINLGPGTTASGAASGAGATATTSVVVTAGTIIVVAVAATLAIDCYTEGSCIWEEVSASDLADQSFWCNLLTPFGGGSDCIAYEPNPDYVTVACTDGITAGDIWQECRDVYSDYVVEDGYLWDNDCGEVWADRNRGATDPSVQTCDELVDLCVDNTVEVCDYHGMMDSSDDDQYAGYPSEEEYADTGYPGTDASP